jgi:hypothetical protein
VAVERRFVGRLAADTCFGRPYSSFRTTGILSFAQVWSMHTVLRIGGRAAPPTRSACRLQSATTPERCNEAAAEAATPAG